MFAASRLGQAVGEAVQDLRTSRQWSQEDLARRLQELGLPWARQQVTDLERGRRQDLNLGEIFMLSEALDVPLVDLLPEVGVVQIGRTERSLPALRALLEGQVPPDADLLGPVALPGIGTLDDPFATEEELASSERGRLVKVQERGPWFWWIRNLPGGQGSQMYTVLERAVSRQLNVPVEDIHRVALDRWQGRIIDLELRRRRGDPEAVRRELLDELKAALAP